MAIPSHPGDVLAAFLAEQDITDADLAEAINVPLLMITRLISGQSEITTDVALRLGKRFCTGPKFWLNLQQDYDLFVVKKVIIDELDRIKPLHNGAFH